MWLSERVMWKRKRDIRKRKVKVYAYRACTRIIVQYSRQCPNQNSRNRNRNVIEIEAQGDHSILAIISIGSEDPRFVYKTASAPVRASARGGAGAGLGAAEFNAGFSFEGAAELGFDGQTPIRGIPGLF